MRINLIANKGSIYTLAENKIYSGMKYFSLLALAFIVTISSCSKKNADDWVGTYNGQSGQAIQRVIVEKVDASTLRIQLQTPFAGSFATYATIGSAKITSATNITIDEDGNIAGFTDTYSFTGSGNLNGKALTISGSAASKTNASDVKAYYFTGSK
jgi:hypothetical protein